MLEANSPSDRARRAEPESPLIGRQQEVEAICRLIGTSHLRLFTLTGPGGVGKTRLAEQIGITLSDDFRDGYAFVSFEPICDPARVLPTIAQTLGLTPETLVAGLSQQQRLLVLDNVEHVIAAAPLLPELLALCPHLKLLVTSRERLRVAGEQMYAVQPLILPGAQDLADLEALARVPAVAFFLSSARTVSSDFLLTPTNAADIMGICLRLDGLPLALQLAASCIQSLSPRGLLKRLERRLLLLTGGARDLFERQQSLRSSLQWSYDLLDAQEQCLFRRLAVFAGGCTLEAVESYLRRFTHVCSHHHHGAYR